MNTRTVNWFRDSLFELLRSKERGQTILTPFVCKNFFKKMSHLSYRLLKEACKLDKTHAGAHFVSMLDSKLSTLRDTIHGFGSLLVAYSGGVDSVFLAFLANEVLPQRSLAVIADSPSLPRRELHEALAIAEKFKLPVRVVKTAEFDNPEYTSNPLNRCYFCKHELFTKLVPVAKDLGLAVIAYGENASDTGDFRPGAKAASEFQIRAPLKEVGLTKLEIRSLSAHFGLPTTDKPQMACLSSRVPHGEPVTEQKLRVIEAAESILREFGFFDVRVRHHELPIGGLSAGASTGLHLNNFVTTPRRIALARIEVGATELPRFLDVSTNLRVVEELKRLGYTHVTLDLQGYRRGGANSLLPSDT